MCVANKLNLLQVCSFLDSRKVFQVEELSVLENLRFTFFMLNLINL